MRKWISPKTPSPPKGRIFVLNFLNPTIMEEQEFSMESLYEKAKAYTDTTLELTKLKAVDKTAGILGTVVARMAVLLTLLMFGFCANMALALWLGSLLGEAWLGFLVVAGFYVLIALLLHFVWQEGLRKKIADAFISQVLS